jgi:DNA uptake protein ComE-like DNA-binding protein
MPAEYILFQPPTWQSVIVYDKGEYASLLAQGWRRERPEIVEPVPETEEELTDQLPEDTGDQSHSSGKVNVNTASTKTLTVLHEVGIAKAKLIIKSRPYLVIEDLIEKVQGIDWLSIESQIEF